MRKKKDVFCLWIRVSTYAYKYLIDNYSVQDSNWPELVNIYRDPLLSAELKRRIAKPCSRYDKRLEKETHAWRKKKIALEISEDDFYRHGWLLTHTDESYIASMIEKKVKAMLMTHLAGMFMVTGNLEKCIDNFYRNFGYSDETWPRNSIRKIWDRSTLDKTSLSGFIEKKITSLLMVQLSRIETNAQHKTKS